LKLYSFSILLPYENKNKRQLNLNKQEKFLELFNPYKDNLSRYCRAICYSYDDAKDLMSETILAAYQSFENLNEEKAFLSYLFTIASRLNMQRAKKQSIFEKIDDRDFVLNQNIEAVVDVEILYSVLKLLPLKQAEAIILFEINGLSLEEINEIQGGTLSGVKSRLKRARESLKEILGSIKYEKKTEVELKN
jgi:RNA polymerase sigma-70 factor (ECF subfamily)